MENTAETSQKEPLFNVPPLTFWLSVILLVCFGCLQNERIFSLAVPMLSFVPKLFSTNPVFSSYTLLSYALLHFGWIHIATNTAGLLAFGSGVERLMGKKTFCMVFTFGVIFGALGHWLLFPHGEDPLGGASAGISALFGAALPLLLKQRDLIIACIVFVLTNLVVGIAGVPQQPGLAIAWQAHIVGFFFGQFYAFGWLYFRFKRKK